MDKDFVISYDTMYDDRDYRADSEAEQDDGQIEDYEYIPPWEMEW